MALSYFVTSIVVFLLYGFAYVLGLRTQLPLRYSGSCHCRVVCEFILSLLVTACISVNGSGASISSTGELFGVDGTEESLSANVSDDDL